MNSPDLRLALLSLLLVCMSGCGDDGRARLDSGATPRPDVSVRVDAGPGADSGPGVDSGPGGVDAGAPTTCPCAPGYYCDIATSMCVVGCAGDSDCPSTEYCITDERRCVTGCRIGQCPDGELCEPAERQCRDACAGCEDDNNPCTIESCATGVCETSVERRGVACEGIDDGNECTAPQCDGEGNCTNVQVERGTECDLGNPCNRSTCESGTCVLQTEYNDGWSCDAEFAEVCVGGSCRATSRVCRDSGGNDRTFPGGSMVWLCGCGSGNTFRVWASSSTRNPVEYSCGSCVEYNSTHVCFP